VQIVHDDLDLSQETEEHPHEHVRVAATERSFRPRDGRAGDAVLTRTSAAASSASASAARQPTR